jgi:hypothetical protein
MTPLQGDYQEEQKQMNVWFFTIKTNAIVLYVPEESA